MNQIYFYKGKKIYDSRRFQGEPPTEMRLFDEDEKVGLSFYLIYYKPFVDWTIYYYIDCSNKTNTSLINSIVKSAKI